MLKKVFRITSMLLVISILTTTVYANKYVSAENRNDGKTDTEIEIEQLLDDRASVLNKVLLNTTVNSQQEYLSELNSIDIRLARLGATFLSDSEVAQKFPEIKDRKVLSLSGEAQLNNDENDVQPRAVAPDSSINTWVSYRSTVIMDGVRYNVQRLSVQPNVSGASPLKNVGSKTITFSNNWRAGAVNALSSFAKATVSGVVQDIPAASIALTFFDAVSSYITGMSTTTEVDVPHISYTWSNVTTAIFAYVKLEYEDDEEQRLSLVSTHTQTVVTYNIPSFRIIGNSTVVPEIIQGSRTIKAIPENCNSSELAINAYRYVSGGPIQACVNHIEISGPESTRVVSIFPCRPAFPLHCEY